MSAFQQRHMMQLSIPHRRDDAEWRRIHDEKPKLEAFEVQWSCWATKKGKPGVFTTAWNKRYWALAGQFLVYFDSDKPSEKAGGCIYLNNSKLIVGKDEEGHANILVIQPMVPRRPGMPLDDPSNEWVLSFESPGELKTAHGVR